MKKFMSVLILLVGCGGTDSGNPKAVSLVMQAIDKSTPLGLVLDSGIEITAAKAVVDRVRYRPFDSCSAEEDESVTALSSPELVDLLDPVALIEFDPSVQKICRLDVRLTDDHSFSALTDLSMKIEGKRADMTPFVIEIELEREFSVRNTAIGISLSSNTLYILGFNVNEWFQGVNLNGATIVDGQITISDGSNEELLELIVDNIKTSASFHRDDDDDGEYDDNDEELGDDDD